MDLQNFIKESIVDIVKGVAEAREIIKKDKANVGSDLIGDLVNYTDQGVFRDIKNRVISHLEFDVAVTENDSSEKKAGIGVFFGNVSLGTQGKENEGFGNHSRIKFKIPIVFPGEEN